MLNTYHALLRHRIARSAASTRWGISCCTWHADARLYIDMPYCCDAIAKLASAVESMVWYKNQVSSKACEMIGLFPTAASLPPSKPKTN